VSQGTPVEDSSGCGAVGLIGGDGYRCVDQLMQIVVDISCRGIHVRYVEASVGVYPWSFDRRKMKSLGRKSEESMI
jgi:hypothetical protein